MGWAILLSLILLGAQVALGSEKVPGTLIAYGGQDAEANWWYLTDENVSPLADGDTVMAIWAGPDGFNDPPVLAVGSPYNGRTTGDDRVMQAETISWGGFTISITTWDVGDLDSLFNQRQPAVGQKVYIRVFNTANPVNATYYGDSDLHEVAGGPGEKFYAHMPNDPDGPTTDTQIFGRFFKIIGGINPTTGQTFALKDSVADLEDGDIVRLIWVGPDGQVNDPDPDRTPGGDDELIATWGVNEGMAPSGTGLFRKYASTFDDPSNGRPALGDTVYVRVFNDDNILEATHYGDSPTYAVSYVIGESLSVFYDDQVDCDMPLTPFGAKNFTIYGGLDTTDMSYWPLVDGDEDRLGDGDLVQLIWAGPDNLIDALDGTTGMPTGDDSLLATWGIGYGYPGTNLGRFKYELFTYEAHTKGGYPAQGDHIYLRVFDDTTTGITSVATWYGETPTYQVMWEFDEKFYSFPDSNFDATVRTPWFASAEWPNPSASLPTAYALFQNYPNPFNPETDIQYQIPEAGWVELTIYNVLGQRIHTLVDDHREVGKYTVRWSGTDSQGKALSSGIYFYRLRAGDFVDVRKMVLMK